MRTSILQRIEAIEQARGAQCGIKFVYLPPMTLEESEMLNHKSREKTGEIKQFVVAFIEPEHRPARPIEELRRLVAEAMQEPEKALEANDEQSHFKTN